MKKVASLFVIILLLTLAACTQGKAAVFTARVLENRGTVLLVQPQEGEQELKSADQITVPFDATLVREDGTSAGAEEFTAGSLIKITYDGSLMESYPAQIAECYQIMLLKETE